MKSKVLVLIGVSLSVGLLTALQAADDPKKGNNQDYDKLAENVVTRSARIKQGDLVQITGQFKDAALLEALAVQVRKQGGRHLIDISSDRLNRRLLDDVPAKFDSDEPKWDVKLAEIIDARITVDSEDEQTLADVPTERLTAIRKAAAPVFPRLLKRNVRFVGLGNGLYPTDSRAKQYGLSEAELARIFWDGLNVDYAKLQAIGEKLQEILGQGKDLQVTNANGTDLKVKIEKRPVFVSDGNLTPEKIKKGGSAVQTWLPAGEVYVAPVVGSAEGKVVIDRVFFEGKEVLGLTMTLKGGKVTELNAKSGGERLLEMYKAADAGKEQFAVVDIGINPNVRIPKDSKMLVYMASGMVSLWTGNDTWAGGENNALFDIGGFLPGSTVKVDGKSIVENGALRL
jgi:leucyl aminopeptidase (aminopeptidase T)